MLKVKYNSHTLKNDSYDKDPHVRDDVTSQVVLAQESLLLLAIYNMELEVFCVNTRFLPTSLL